MGGDDRLRTVLVFELTIPTLRPPTEFTLGLVYFMSVRGLKAAPGITISEAIVIARRVLNDVLNDDICIHHKCLNQFFMMDGNSNTNCYRRYGEAAVVGGGPS
jgi:hypothetical protein